MGDKKTINHWAEIGGGFRGSIMLRLGAVAAATGALINLGSQLLAGAAGPSLSVTIVAWLFYILGLWLLAGGFFLVASQPFFTRFGFLVSTMHAAHGILLLVLLFTFTAVPIPPISVTVGRLLATLIFAFTEREWITQRTQSLLIAAVGLQLLKSVGRALGYLPEFGMPIDPLLDAMLLLFLASVMLHLGTVVRHEEDEWAEMIHETGNADFADFNNPEHEWNKEKNTQRKK